MPNDARQRFAGAVSALLAAACAVGAAAAPGLACAQGLFSQPKYAALVEDANTGEVLYAMRADALRHPASLTKVMTLYLTFEALSTGRLRMNDVITISAHANSMAPSKISNHPGETLTVAEAIPTMTVHSANDVAVAMAERLAGSEGAFAQLMTTRAKELGMTETSFVNASGLPPDGQQISSARDMAILARAVMRDYPQYYHFFNMKSYDFRGKVLMNHNHLVGRMPGVDGMKTGYTSLAGFNLIASGVRDGHRLITVVLGGPSVAARDENVEELLDAGFTVLRDRSMGHPMRLASLISSPEDMSGPVTRPPVEEGSGDQQNLRVEVEPTLRTLQMNAAAAAVADTSAPPADAAAKVEPVAETTDCAAVRRTRRHRRHAPAACETAVAKAAAAPTPAKAADKTEVADADAACKPRGRHRRRAACATPAAVQTAAASAKDADKTAVATVDPACAPKGRRHRHAACADANAAGLQTAEANSKAAGGKDGGFMIQVGAYKSRALAKGQVDKIGPLVTGSGEVQEANGNYRARFRGLTKVQAAAACRSLSAKGQACMVMSDS